MKTRAYHECQDQSMQHEHREGSGVQNTGLKANVQHDEFDKTEQQQAKSLAGSTHVSRWETHPLQLIRAPMAPDSRKLKPHILAAMEQGRNLAQKETTHSKIVYPQVIPLFKRPKFVLRPERVKYWRGQVSHHGKPCAATRCRSDGTNDAPME